MRRSGLIFVCLLLVLLTLAGCAQQTPPEETTPAGTGETTLALTSSAFTDGANIPEVYTCKGENKSPELSWAGLPAGTASLALIMDDPDATVGTFTHWVVFNLPKDSAGLPEGIIKDTVLAGGTLQGNSGARRIGYVGPCPPKGGPHHYTFTLYALDITLSLEAGATKDQVLQAAEGHILGQAQLVGLYQNSQQ
ncbi:MAG TPA: YbhB/YbcL family Raf kinase inhibitor-like protein [Dehalococcoidia bacterium]|jgi:Raf kinase inhibitor-like YbhB/YbcL family protein